MSVLVDRPEDDLVVGTSEEKLKTSGKKKDKGKDVGIVEGLAIDEKLLSKLTKENGKIFRGGMEVLEESRNKAIISISPAHDIALGGGVKEGTWIVLTGNEKSGKSSLALNICAAAQMEENGSRQCIYLDGEGRLKDMNLAGIDGLNPSMMHIISAADKALAAEDALMMIESFLKDNEKLVVVIDSVSSLLPRRDLESELSGERRPGLPKLMGDFTKKLSGIVPRKGHIVVMITRFIADLSMSKKLKTSDGGNHLRYQADTMLEIPYIQPWEEGDKRVGQLVHWKVLCSACGGIPGTEYVSYLRYGHGIDKTAEIVEMGSQFGLIKKGGAWFYLGEEKFQGQAKLVEYLKENPLIQENLLKELKELLA